MHYDQEKTTALVHKHACGNSLDPLVMLNEGQQEIFRKLDSQSHEISQIKETDADQGARISAAEARQNKLENRLWGLLAAFLTAIVSGGVGLWFTSGG